MIEISPYVIGVCLTFVLYNGFNYLAKDGINLKIFLTSLALSLTGWIGVLVVVFMLILHIFQDEDYRSYANRYWLKRKDK